MNIKENTERFLEGIANSGYHYYYSFNGWRKDINYKGMLAIYQIRVNTTHMVECTMGSSVPYIFSLEGDWKLICDRMKKWNEKCLETLEICRKADK